MTSRKLSFKYSISVFDRRLWFHRQSVHCDIMYRCCIHYTISRDSFRSCSTSKKKKKKDKTGTIRSSGIFLLVSTLTINLITFYCNHFITPMTQEFKMWFNPCVSLSQHYPFLTVFDLLYNLFYYSYPFMIVQYMNMNHWCGSCNHGTWKDGHEYVLIIPLSIDQSFYLKFFNK